MFLRHDGQMSLCIELTLITMGCVLLMMVREWVWHAAYLVK